MRSPRPLAALFAFAMVSTLACGGDGEAAQATATATGSAPPINNSQPVLKKPVGRFAVSLDELPAGYVTDRNATFVLDAENYGATASFASPAEGAKALKSWGYVEGYETAFEPEQRFTAVLNGRFFAAVEVHLFESSDGAAAALDYFEQRLRASSDPVSAARVGNESSSWKLTREKVPGSSVDAVYHRVIFRRGNLVAIVQTYGSDALMSIKPALELAAIIDAKALGERPAVEPTPLGQPSPAPTARP